MTDSMTVILNGRLMGYWTKPDFSSPNIIFTSDSRIMLTNSSETLCASTESTEMEEVNVITQSNEVITSPRTYYISKYTGEEIDERLSKVDDQKSEITLTNNSDGTKTLNLTTASSDVSEETGETITKAQLDDKIYDLGGSISYDDI